MIELSLFAIFVCVLNFQKNQIHQKKNITAGSMSMNMPWPVDWGGGLLVVLAYILLRSWILQIIASGREALCEAKLLRQFAKYLF